MSSSKNRSLKPQRSLKQPERPSIVSNITGNLVTPVTIPEFYDRLEDDEDETAVIKAVMGSSRPIVAKYYKEAEVGREMGEKVFALNHPSVLQYYGEIQGIDTKPYFLYESYRWTLKDLLGDRKFQYVLDGRVTYIFQEIIKDILAGLEFLHSKGISHGNVQSSNIALLPLKEDQMMTPDDKLLVKLMGIRNDGNFLEDYHGVALIVKEFMGNSSAEANDFFKSLLNCEFNPLPLGSAPDSVLTIWDLVQEEPKVLLKHPFLWDGGKFLQFIIKVGDLLAVARASYNLSFGLASFVKALNHFVIPNGWLNHMPQTIRTKISDGDQFYDYKTRLTSELCRFIRDKHVHYADMGIKDQEAFGPPPTAYFIYFHREFP